MSSNIDTPPITAQQYELLHGGGAEAAEIAKQRLSRRRFLRRSMLTIWGLSTTASVAGALYMMYPRLGGQFGSPQNIGKKGDFASAAPAGFKINEAGVYHVPTARTYLIHLAQDTQWEQQEPALADQMAIQSVVKDPDGSFWIALYQRCVHLGCTVPFRDSCLSFKCPCHGSHYNIDGGFLAGPAPRSMDRFEMTFSGDDIIVNTGVINNTVPHPDASTRLIPVPTVSCE